MDQDIRVATNWRCEMHVPFPGTATRCRWLRLSSVLCSWWNQFDLICLFVMIFDYGMKSYHICKTLIGQSWPLADHQKIPSRQDGSNPRMVMVATAQKGARIKAPYTHHTISDNRNVKPHRTSWTPQCKWGFPKMGIPPDHPFYNFSRIFHYKPSIFGVPPFMETPI